MAKPTIRVGLVLDGPAVPAWAHRVIEDIVAGRYARLCVVVTAPAAAKPFTAAARRDPLSRCRRRLRAGVTALLTTIYVKLIQKRPRLPDALAREDATDTLAGIPTVAAAPARENGFDDLAGPAIEAITAQQPQVLLALGGGRPHGTIRKVAGCSIWWLRHAPQGPYADGPGFWESVTCRAVTAVLLVCVDHATDRLLVLSRSIISTDQRSARDNTNRYYWKARLVIARALSGLHAMGPSAFFGEARQIDTFRGLADVAAGRPPGAARLAGSIRQKTAAKIARSYRKKRSYDQWILLYALDADPATPLARYRTIAPPGDRFWADPHVVHAGGWYHIFVEEYIYAEKKGRIAVITMDKNGGYGEAKPVLAASYHLSYPFVFQDRDDYFMIPESSENKTVDLYRCKGLPDRWTYEKTLLSGVQAVDTTVFYHDGLWWLFTNIGAGYKSSTWDDLFLFYARDLFTDEWCAHPCNPIVSDCRSARPAGRVFAQGGRLYRASQNCAWQYGYGFNIQEITVLDVADYRERLVRAVVPDWHAKITATHTFNRVGALSVADALYRRRVLKMYHT